MGRGRRWRGYSTVDPGFTVEESLKVKTVKLEFELSVKSFMSD